MRPWESVIPLRENKETDCHDQFANWSRNDVGMTRCVG